MNLMKNISAMLRHALFAEALPGEASGQRASRRIAEPFVVLLCLLAVFTGAPAGAREYLVNGGFERGLVDGVPDGWRVNGAVGLGGTHALVKDASAAHSGEYSLQLTSDPPARPEMALMSPPFDIRQGTYEVKASAKGSGKFTVYLYQYDSAGAFVSSAPFAGEATSDWKDYTWPYSPAADVARVAYALHASGKVYFDDCAFTGIQVSAAPAEDLSKVKHFLTIPAVQKAPVVDGKFSEAEWSKAAATTGFVRNDKMLAASVQPVVYSCYDDKSLYIAIVSPIPSGKTLAANIRGIGGAVWEDDDVELLLQPGPPDGTVFHLLASPAGGFSGFKDERPYNDGLVYKCEMTSDTWVAEFDLSFDALGVSKPADGEVWGVNFCRGWVNPREWTCWSPAVSFTDASKFGRMRFGGSGSYARVVSLGGISAGEVNLSGGVVTSGSPVSFTAGAGPNDLMKKETVDATNIMFVGKSDAEILGAQTQRIETSGSIAFEKKLDQKESRLIWELADASDNFPIQRHSLDIQPLPPLVLTLDCSPKRGDLKALLSTTGLYAPGSPVTGTVSLIDKTGKHPAKLKAVVFDKEKGEAVFALKDIPVGDYAVEATVLGAGGKRAVTAVALFSNAGPVPAAYAKVGYQPEVPAPWTPVEVAGNEVRVWNRSIVFGGNGLPASVVSADQNLLQGPTRLRAYSKGTELAGKEGKLSVKRLSPGAAETKSSVSFPGLMVNARSRTEFDGCIRVDLDVKAAKGGPDSLVLEIPFDKSSTDLIHANILGYEPTWSGSIPSGNGTVWSQDFIPVIWLGNTIAGMCWFAESQRGWGLPASGGSVSQEIVRDGESVTLKIHLARAQFKPGVTHRIVFGLQPTPVKSIPADWRLTRMGAGNPFLEDPLRRDSFIPEPGSKWWGWPEPFSQAEYDQRMADIKSGAIKVRDDMMPFSPKIIDDARELVHGVGARLIWYAPTQELANNSPWFSTYGKDWALTYGVPGREFPDDPWGNASAVCPNSKFQDLYVGTMDMSMTKNGFDGAYIDLFYPWKCANAAHGCGYVDESGRRQSEYCIWSMREEMKRLYRVVHSRKNGYIMGHISASYLPAVHGFVDTAVDGEQYQTHFTVAKGVDYHDVLTLEKCRAEVSGRQWGWIPMWLPQFWVKVARPSSRQMLSLIMLHDCLVWPAYMDSGEYHLANATLTKLGYVKSQFIGYYDKQSPANADNSDVFVSAYKNPGGDSKRAILFVTNHGLTKGTFTITPNVQVLGLGSDNWTASECPDMTARKPLARNGAGFEIEIAGKDFAIVALEGR